MSVFDRWTRGGNRDWTRHARSGYERAIEAALLRSKIVLGRAGTGKSYAGRHDIKAAADAADTFILLEDMHGVLCDDVLGDLGPRHESRIEVLDLDKPSTSFGVEVGQLSDDPNPEDRQTEDDYAVERALALIGAEQAVNFNTAPLKGGWSRKALRLRWRQDPPKPFVWVRYALRPGHPNQLVMLNDCWDRELADEFWRVNAYRSVAQQDAVIAAARRLIDDFVDNRPVESLLTKPPVPWGLWVAEHKIVLARASMDTPETIARPVFGFLRHLTYREAKGHHARTGRPAKTLVYADEAARLGVNAAEVNQLQQVRKCGAACTFVFQSPPRTAEFKDILQAVRSLEIFAQGGKEDAEWCAGEALALLWDMHKQKSVERRERVVNRGQTREEVRVTSDRFDKDGKKDGYTEGVHFLTTPQLDTVIDEHVTYAGHGDQLADLVREIRRLDVGWRMVIDGARALTERVPEVHSRWRSETSRRLYLTQLLERVRSRPHYRAAPPPPPSIAVPAKAPTPRGGRGMRRSKNS